MRKSRVRILYIQKVPIGGTVTGLYELVKGLDLKIYDPIVLFLEPSIYADKFRELGAKVIIFDDPSHSLKRNTSALPKRDIAASLSRLANWLGEGYRILKQLYLFIRKDLPLSYRIHHVIKATGVDFVHQNDNLPADRATVLGTIFCNIPQVCHIRTLKKLSYIEKFLSRFVNALIYMSTSIETEYIQQGISAEKGKVIYDAFDPKEYEEIDSNQIAGLKSEFKILDGEKIICNIGRLARWKGQDVFLKAMAEVIKTDPDTKAIIVGPTNSSIERKIYFNELKKLVNDLGLTNHVLFTGFRSDIPQIMVTSDIVVHSSSEPEPFGRVIVEGMLAGKPVIATAAGGVLDIITDEVTGLLVPIKDSKAMANAIRYLLNNPEIAKRISDKAKEDARRRFNVNQHVQAVQNIYYQITEAVH